MSTMKFLQLPLGQQFEFRGQHYTKVAPLIASNNADGKQKMIPRSALVTVADDTSPQKRDNEKAQHPALEVLERYHQTVLAELQSLGDDEAKLGAARVRLEALKEEVMKAIG
jgi:hypothetical protein